MNERVTLDGDEIEVVKVALTYALDLGEAQTLRPGERSVARSVLHRLQRASEPPPVEGPFWT